MVETSSYDGFISYSHAADDLLAPRLQAGLQRFAKPWWKRRALRVFRDESSLSANPHLWSSITSALDDSEWFVLLLSEDAAQSEWVNREIEYWLANKPADRILPVVTDGEFGWENADVSGSAAPEALSGVFSEEPRWVDLRWARTDEHLDLSNPRFSDAIADVASAIRGVAKDELASEEVRQHRRTIRTAWSAGVVVLLLGIAAAVGAIIAVGQSDEAQDQRDEAQRQAQIADENAEEAQRQEAEAERQAEIANEERKAALEAQAEAERLAEIAEQERDRAEGLAAAEADTRALAEARELAAAAIGVLDLDPELSVLLGVQALRSAPEGDDPAPEARIALRQAVHASFLTNRYATGLEEIGLGDVSDDGSRLAVTTESSVSLFEIEPWLPIWTIHWADLGLASEAEGCFAEAWFLSAHEVVVGFIDEEADDCFAGVGPDDQVVTGLAILSVDDGSVLRYRLFGPCPSSITGPPSPDGGSLVVVVGEDGGCQQEDREWSLELLDATDLTTSASFPVSSIGNPSWSGDGQRVSHTSFHGLGARVFDVTTGTLLLDLPADVFFGTLSPDGTLLAASDLGISVFLLSVETGAVVDRLTDLGDSPFWIDFSEDGSLLIAGGTGAATAAWNVLDGRLRALFPNTGPVATLEYHEPSQTLYHLGQEDLTTWDLSGGVEGARNTADLETWVQGNSVVSEGSRGVLLGLFQDDEWAPFLRTFDATTGVILDATLDVEMGRAPAILQDGRVVAWPADRDGEDWTMGPVVVWDPDTSEAIHLVGCPVSMDQSFEDPDLVECVGDGEFFDFDRAFSLSGTRFAVTSRAGPDHPVRVLVFDSRTFELVDEFEAPPSVAAIEEMGDGWIVGSNLRTGVSSDAKEFTLYGTGSWEPMVSVRAAITQPSRDRDLLAIPVTGGGIVVVDTSSGTTVAELTGGSARVRGLAFSPDGTLLMTSATDGFVRIWGLSTEREVERIPLDPHSGDGVWIDSDTIAIGTQNGLWTNLSIDPDELLELAVGRLRRSFTQDECDLYRIDPCPTLEDLRSG